MKLTRTVTIVTANLGRGVPTREFKANVDRIKNQTPGRHRFFGFQEIDEADVPEELDYLRKIFGNTHRFVGVNTRVPILVPHSFKISRRIITPASDGVKGLSPQRHVVQALVHPEEHRAAKLLATNTHFGRNIAPLAASRESAEHVLRARLRTKHAGWMTGDLNSSHYPRLAPREIRFVSKRLDYIRGYERKGVSMKLLDSGTINLTIDGHDAHWARVRITWTGPGRRTT